ncbi:C4-dicarboxylate ABC transporter permease, partial [bacterium]|nr:C4-dicarboxylate ABC transporter permease [bacterium]
MIALSYSLGWDALIGLGMSVLATNMGFSAAITNPFTIGVAQKLAGLPLFSGGLFRIPI